MIHLDTENPAYEFRSEVLRLVAPPPGSIPLAEIAELLGLCGTYEIHQAVKALLCRCPGLSLRRTKGFGYVLKCTKSSWPDVERMVREYLARLEAGRKCDAV